MTTQIKLTSKLGGHDAGSTIHVTNGTAQHLIDTGYAEAVETKTTRTKRTSSEATDSPGGASS
jgi:hypothetical protein